MHWFEEQYGILPRRAGDPLRLGRRRRKRVFATSITIGTLLLTLTQSKASAAPGQQLLQSYIEVKTKDDGHWHLRDLIPCATIVFFTSGTSGTTSTSFPGWNNSANIVEVIGGGTTGGAGTACVGGSGGTGGGYALKNNVALGATFSYQIAGAGGTTWFGSASTVAASTAGTFGDVLRSGGTGGGPGGNIAGGGGGGAAGKNGGGNNGGAGSVCPQAGGTGGAGNAGTGGSGGGSTAGGNNGQEWTSSAGPKAGAGGGGGGAQGGAGNGGAGGLYGGGGGGAAPGQSAGGGQQGLIVVTYTPNAAAYPLAAGSPKTMKMPLGKHQNLFNYSLPAQPGQVVTITGSTLPFMGVG